MNVSRPVRSTTPSPSATVVVAFGTRPVVRERDFGVGYGKSSGYASGRRYSPASQPRFFRFA